jgi:thiamine-phosphate pyrophosphorylase
VTPWPSTRPVLYFVADRSRLPEPSSTALVRRIRAAAKAGIDVVQVREHSRSDYELLELVREAIAAVQPLGVPVVVNDRVDVAIAAGAAGVHLRGASIAAERVREIAPPGFLVGRSVHSREEAEAAARAGGCDYLIFGTVYPSAGKAPDHAVAGEAALADVCARLSLPVLAIGGVDGTRAGAVAAAGAAGIAAIGAFVSADEDLLRATIQSMRTAFHQNTRA